jgi:galactose mutarotase-like enzyme
MKHRIESSELLVEVNSFGMEISSIRSSHTNQEYLWQGDPAFWTGQAPVLFPIIGRLKNGQMTYKGKSYDIPKHGFVRNISNPKVIDFGKDFLKMEVTCDADSLKIYPFKFKLEMSFILKGKTLHVSHSISNEGEETMLYSVGGHPAFNCPLYADEVYSDYFLEFEKEETDSTWMIDPNGLIDKDQKLVLDHTKKLPLHAQLFDQDALVFKNLRSRRVSLVSQNRGPVLAVEFEDFNYLGIWAKPNAPFVCIEPWLGIADSVNHNQKFEEKEGILTLPAGKSTQKIYSITILE